MSIEHVLAVVTVTDIAEAVAWYEQLLGRPPDNRPMPTVAEWRLTASGWLQVFVDPDRAGSSFANVAVDDLDAEIASLRGRGLSPGPVQQADKGVRLCSLVDPAGNVVTLIGNFREVY